MATTYNGIKVYNCTGKGITIYDRNDVNIVTDVHGLKMIWGNLSDCVPLFRTNGVDKQLKFKHSYKKDESKELSLFSTKYIKYIDSFEQFLDDGKSIIIVNKNFAEAAKELGIKGYKQLYFPATPVYEKSGILKGFLGLVNLD